MKRLMCLFLCLVLGVGFASLSAAQGTINFANAGGGVHAPVSGPDRLLGAGFFAQLQLADGTDVGEPPFLANGLFSGGVRTIEGVEAGLAVELQVWASNADGSKSGYSDVFTVTLGGGTTPAAPLSGLQRFSISRLGDQLVENHAVCEAPNCWAYDVENSAGVECTLGGGILARVRVDPCFCEHIPFPEKFRRVDYRVTNEGQIEMSWIRNAGLSLFGTEQLSAESVEEASEIGFHGVYPNGTAFVRYDAKDSMRFFWLGKRSGLCD